MSIENDSTKFAGKVIVVTGGGQGIGAYFARELGASGATVVVIDINEANAEQVAASIDGDAIGLGVDVSSLEHVSRARQTALDRFGHIDGLVNCAAIFSSLAMRPFDEIPIDEWDAVMAVNVKGTYLCCREFGAAMRDRGQGRIVNLSSGTAFMGRPNYLHYVTSKAAILGLTRALARELGLSGITVNALAPGSTETEVVREAMTPAAVESVVAAQSVKRRQTPEDLLSGLFFLLDDSSSFITGQTVVIDGGVVFN